MFFWIIKLQLRGTITIRDTTGLKIPVAEAERFVEKNGGGGGDLKMREKIDEQLLQTKNMAFKLEHVGP